MVRKLLNYISRGILSKNIKFKNKHKGEECYIFGNGSSIKYFELSKFSDINNVLLNEKLEETSPKTSSFKKEKNEVILEVDLHINQLIKNTKGMDNFDMLTLQLNTAKSKIEYAISKRISKIIFIHGVGEGVLKNELHYLFGRYPVRFYDASYKKYGLGATEVYVYQNQKS